MKNLHLEFLLLVSAIAVAKANEKPQNNSSQLHALSDLTAAKWLIGHRPGSWELTKDELNAIKEIDETIKSIKGAAIDNNKSIDDYPALDKNPQRMDRLREADNFLKKAHGDIDQKNYNSFGNGLRNNLYEHVDATVMAVKTSIYLN
jgi:hypothetical protein